MNGTRSILGDRKYLVQEDDAEMWKLNYEIIDDERCILGKRLIVKQNWDSRFKTLIEKNQIKELVLNCALGFDQTDFEFLSGLGDTDLRALFLYNNDTIDMTPLGELDKIEYLGLDCKMVKAPNFSNFESLKFFSCSWRACAESVFSSSSVENLGIDKYPFKNFEPTEAMKSLKVLSASSRKLTELQGIGEHTNLESLSLSYCPSLSNISDLKKSKIKEIELYSCKNIRDISDIGEMPYLESLSIENCGEINSLAALKHLQNLKVFRLIGDCNVADSNLSILTSLPNLTEVSIRNRKHYDYTSEQLQHFVKRDSQR